MKFISLNELGRVFGWKNSYYKTPIPFSSNYIMTGEPQFLNPESWDAYEIFMTTPQLYAVIQRRGYLLSSGVWKHYKAGIDGKPILIENSPIVSVLEQPNPLMRGNDLLRQWNENMCVYGNNYEYMLKPFKSAHPSGLSNISPTIVSIKTTGKTYKQSKIEDIIEYYEITNGTNKDVIPTNEINQSRLVNGINPIKGESPMRSLYMPISNIRAAYQFRNVIMTKRGALGILSNQSKSDVGAIPLKEDERKRIEESYQSQFGIGEDQLKMILTNASLTYQAMSYPTKDLMLFEEVDADFRTIIDAYGLNDNLFSREKGSTFTNMAEGMKQAYQSTIIPEAEEIAMNRSKVFGLIAKGEWLELDYSHIPVLQENLKEKSEILEKKANALVKLKELGTYSDQELRDIIQL